MSSHFTRRYLTVAAIVAATVPALVCAKATADEHDRVVFTAGDTPRAAFAKGQPLVETEHYKVHASRRDAPGMAEVHQTDTDIIYVLDGSATLVTGGAVVGGAEVAPHEVRGRAIEGGTAQQLAKGDVVIVPSGVAHWFRDVQAPLLYYVVKTTGGAR
jgi:mannose-6-phosphate isomerase-like protein (cupin superfamily)